MLTLFPLIIILYPVKYLQQGLAQHRPYLTFIMPALPVASRLKTMMPVLRSQQPCGVMAESHFPTQCLRHNDKIWRQAVELLLFHCKIVPETNSEVVEFSWGGIPTPPLAGMTQALQQLLHCSSSRHWAN